MRTDHEFWLKTKAIADKRKIKPEQFEEKFYQILGDDYELRSDYAGTHNKVLVFHKKCRHLYQVRAGHILYDHSSCRYCLNKKKSKTNRKIFKEIIEANDYEVLKGYSNNHSPIVVRCPQGHIRRAGFQQFKREPTCVYCLKKKNYNAYSDYANEEIIPFLKKYKVTQKRLAISSGIDPSNLNAMMRGNNKFSFYNKLALKRGMKSIKERGS